MRVTNDGTSIIDGTDMSQASLTSKAFWLGHLEHYAIQVVFTGSPVGTFKLQISNDAGDSRHDGGGSVTNWTDLSSSSVSISAAGDLMFVAQSAGYRWVRVVYTKTSGTGTITVVRANGKGPS